MSQIEIQILKQGIIHPNVMSTSFFTMGDSYRSFIKYQLYLETFFKQSSKLKNFEVRVYTDDTGKDFALTASKNYPNVSIYHFNCAEFRDKVGHVGTFGTLVRFLPLFEEHKLVWISDIDIPDFYLIEDDKEHYDFRITTHVCYDRKPYSRNYTILAGMLISRVQLPRALLTRFLNKDNSKIASELNTYNKRKPSSNFPYGMDEVFLNSTVYDWIKKRDYTVYIHKDYMTSLGLIGYNTKMTRDDLNFMVNYYTTRDKKYIPKVKTLLKKYIPNVVDKYPCLQEVLDKLDSFKNSFEEKFTIKSSDL